MSEQRTRLETKLRDNRLRRRWEEVLGELRASLRDRLIPAELVMSERAAQTSFMWPWPSPILSEDPPNHATQSASVVHEQFDTRPALRRATGLKKPPRQAAFLWLDPITPIARVHGDLWYDEGHGILEYIGRSPDAFLAFVCEDGSAGILVTEYVGTLPERKRSSRSELIYELTTWGLC